MNLRNKKELAAKALGVGKRRIKFNTESLPEIKEAITKEDIKTLYNEGIISIKPVKGRKKIVRRKIRRGPGKIKKKIKTRKQDYVKITRKLRRYVRQLRSDAVIDRDKYIELRKKIRMRNFKSKGSLKEYVENLKKAVPVKEEKKTIKKKTNKENK
ncbi:50S ribosomal protein L19e [uncultured archaeon]|nr:50S ribosomal protein L19e [uncultured archaeon]